ncbi:MAG: hypothetical protein WC595_02850 [Candidatus Nanoarchaeia archaeon]
MVKFVLDSDGVIKLTKAELIRVLAKKYDCVITQQVYEELMEGKKKMYEDAFVVEELVEEKEVKVKSVKLNSEMDELGKGEHSILEMWKNENADAVISDDRKFLSILEKGEIPFLRPVEVIVMLTLKKEITKEEGMESLEAIRKFVREESYKEAKKMIGGE